MATSQEFLGESQQKWLKLNQFYGMLEGSLN